MSDDWCTIESDPGVFSQLLTEIGCPSVQLEELWSLDDDSLMALNASGTLYGLIFLFQYQSTAKNAAKNNVLSEEQIPESLFFAHQVTTNACATQAILSVVLNQGDDVQLGPILSEFKEFSASFPPSLKGVAISSSEPIKNAHNSFGRKDSFLSDGKFLARNTSSEDVYHFVAYIPHADGKVYELDGLQEGPIVVGSYATNDDDDNGNDSSNDDKAKKTRWLAVAREAIQQRMQGDAIKFNLMAVMKDKRLGLKEKIEADPTDGSLVHHLNMEEEKRKQWEVENQRRRHNFVPLAVSILRELARENRLNPLFEEAKERKRLKLSKSATKN